MKKKLYIVIALLGLLLFNSCKKDEIEYADGNPSILAGDWVVFEIPQGDFEAWPYQSYSLVTALDPNRDTNLVISNLYNSNVRLRVPYYENKFDEKYVVQFDTIDGFDYNIHYVSLDGEISRNYYVQDLSYQFAMSTFPDMDFDPNDINDVIFINAGFYDRDKMLVDTVIIFGYRKIGFEDVPIN